MLSVIQTEKLEPRNYVTANLSEVTCHTTDQVLRKTHASFLNRRKRTEELIQIGLHVLLREREVD